MTGIDVLAFFLGGAAGYLLGVWASRSTLESLIEQLEATQAALLEQRKRMFAPQWELHRLRLLAEQQEEPVQ